MAESYTTNKIKQIVVPIAQKYGVKRIALFGSYARNEAKEDSDIDFVIEKGAIRVIEFFGFINDLEDELGTSVDVLTYDSLKKSFIADAINDEVVLYER
jgi:predicted nucleotidyltransferase